ncbi:MAG: SDR family NAD(P)-dependent oxidoreductase [Myxococcales bacterium]|nr:SDR family NAD(P)-dependent oxidoreductase [Myxococcales bacterium]
MQRVLVLGATSAVAREFAIAHGARGDRLHLVGRNPAKLEAVVAACAHASAVTSQRADFSDTSQAERTIEAALDALGGPVDRALVAHGVLGDQLETERDPRAAEAILHDNLVSAVALLVPLANAMERAGRGRLAVITSVAGDRGRPRNFTYGAAKGALNVYLQGLRSRLYASGVSVSTIKLGPVDSPMTVDHKKNALFVTPAEAAHGIILAMDARTPEAYVPRVWSLIMPVVKRTPEWLFQRLSFLSGR